MGVDIYAFIEYKQSDDYRLFREIDIPRGDKLLPAIVFGDGGIFDDMLYPPIRGIPSDASPQVDDKFFTDEREVKDYLAISKPEDEPEGTIEDYLEFSGDWELKKYAETGRLPMPELFQPSWLTLTELQSVLKHDHIDAGELTTEVQQMFSIMQGLASEFGADNVRLVFWCGL